ncbi:hypothetical protein F4779DRAFT_639670 [Xylariaceae sp. FL0662B]|nr:hypothetical protein F4779DRAFT_639670 [Xylariaceae sp. FL0662B]
MPVEGQALFVASTLLLANLICAQTIIEAGQVVDVNESNVAPAAEVVGEELQLTGFALANLTNLELSNVSLFQFPENIGSSSNSTRNLFTSCKTYPGDMLWPTSSIWKVFNLLTGGALIETVPIGAVCFTDSEHYDEVKCQNLLEHWTDSATHTRDPTSVMSPLYQGKTCMPQNGETGSTCELGGFPSYVVNISTVAQVQLAVNFARNLNLRLVVHNTGHDFLGKSTGAGAVSIWTHNLKKIEYIETYSGSSPYAGPAFRLGAGVQVGELYAAAQKYNVTAVGGECKGVGVTGGYIAGGGHSPMISKVGLGADQVLSIDVVLPNGRFVTADENNNSDLFWALRGGGGASWGVVTSMTVKVHPRMNFSGMTFAMTSGSDSLANVTTESFWSALELYWRRFPEYPRLGNYAYSSVFARFDSVPGYTWTFHPWLAPGMALTEFKALISPLLEEWKEVGFDVEPVYFEHDNFYDAWTSHFPNEGVASSNVRTASRIFPTRNWEDEALLNKTLNTIRSVIEDGSGLIQYNMHGGAPEGINNAVNPAWRESVMFAIIGTTWLDTSTPQEIKALSTKVTDDYMRRFRNVTPGSGGYGNEGDVMEPDFGQAFFGSNYDRLLQIKAEIDPYDLFWAPTAVGSENWYIIGQYDWLVTQNGRLCRK